MIDVARARRDTPGCEVVAHFNNAGAALMPTPVVERVIAHLRREAEIGGYEAADEASEELRRVYESVATLIGAAEDEIALVENATRAWDMAFYSLPLPEGSRILTSTASYASNYIAFLQRRRRQGLIINVVPDDPSGQISVEDLETMAGPDVGLIALTHVPTSGGLVNPAAEVGRVARERGIPYLLDACQSVGQLPVDVIDIGCTMLSATSRKFLRGPRGAGFLYVAREWIAEMEPPLLDLRAAEWVEPDRYRVEPTARRFETWEGDLAARLGLGAAIEYARSWGVDAIAHYVTTLAEVLRGRLAEIPGVVVTDQGARKCGIVTFHLASMRSEDVQRVLAEEGMNTAVTTRSSTLLDFERRRLPTLVRASLHYYNTNAEIERLCRAVADLA